MASKIAKFSPTPWRSGHRIRLRNRRPGFESRQGVKFFREKHSNAAVYIWLNKYCLCVYLRIKGIVVCNLSGSMGSTVFVSEIVGSSPTMLKYLLFVLGIPLEKSFQIFF
jgi:hypothetical protein